MLKSSASNAPSWVSCRYLTLVYSLEGGVHEVVVPVAVLLVDVEPRSLRRALVILLTNCSFAISAPLIGAGCFPVGSTRLTGSLSAYW